MHRYVYITLHGATTAIEVIRQYQTSEIFEDKYVQAAWLSKIRMELHYPDCWDTAAYPTLFDAIYEQIGCGECKTGTPQKGEAQPTETPVNENIKGLLERIYEIAHNRYERILPLDRSDAYKIAQHSAKALSIFERPPERESGEAIRHLRALYGSVHDVGAGTASQSDDFTDAARFLNSIEGEKP